MRKILFLFLALLAMTNYAKANIFGGEPEDLKKTCTTDVDGIDRIPPKIIDTKCFKKGTLCPVFEDMKKTHRLIVVDTTDKLSKREISYLTSDIFNLKTLVNDIEPYSKVSVYDLNDKKEPAGLDPLVSICRPQRGQQGTPYEADIPHSDQGAGFLQNEFKKWARKVWQTHKILAESTIAKKTLLFEHLNTFSTLSKFDFRKGDYKKRELVLFSDLMQFSESFKFARYCKIFSNRCKDFKRFYDSQNFDNKKYLDEIKPSFSDDTSIVLYHIINKRVKDSNLETELKSFWISFFEWTGVPTKNIEYIRLVDQTSS